MAPTVSADTILLKDLGYGEQIDATAVARAFGSVKLCVLALDEDGSAAIGASRLADIDAAECAVQSNSGQPDGISVDGLSSVTALAICSAGGVDGSSYNPPEAETDCPPVEDPLAGQNAPDPGPCNERNLKIILPRIDLPRPLLRRADARADCPRVGAAGGIRDQRRAAEARPGLLAHRRGRELPVRRRGVDLLVRARLDRAAQRADHRADGGLSVLSGPERARSAPSS